jgi:hypothetical protein
MVAKLGADDHLVEWTGAIACLIASIAFFICYWKDSTGNSFGLFRTKRNLFLLFLGLLALIAFGEEISWGQRILNYATPPAIAVNNVQGELNVHNLRWFDRNRSEGGVLNTQSLFNYFWAFYAFLIPVLVGLSSAFGRWVRKVNVPIIPISLGIGYMANELVFKGTAHYLPKVQRIQEFTEMVTEILIMLMAIHFLMGLRNVGRTIKQKCESEAVRDQSDPVLDPV